MIYDALDAPHISLKQILPIMTNSIFPRPPTSWLQIYLLFDVGNIGTFVLCSIMMLRSRSD